MQSIQNFQRTIDRKIMMKMNCERRSVRGFFFQCFPKNYFAHFAHQVSISFVALSTSKKSGSSRANTPTESCHQLFYESVERILYAKKTLRSQRLFVQKTTFSPAVWWRQRTVLIFSSSPNRCSVITSHFYVSKFHTHFLDTLMSSFHRICRFCIKKLSFKIMFRSFQHVKLCRSNFGAKFVMQVATASGKIELYAAIRF